ncbi:hypothetical protein BHD05_03310 [Marisediminicola antarctica]|uniref:Polysaccharide biosynthesis protein n=1 Tax=Marisediminicola antarctica TaxID=674079 RepID=A0A7L5AI67_9MICO|nr:hypothetical protein BHD05_03310 [Marisediminicola antarctica]
MLIVIAVLLPSEWGRSAALLGIGQFLGAALSFGSPIERIRRYSRLADDEVFRAARVDSVARLAVAALLLALAAVGAFLWPVSGVVLLTACGVFVSMGSSNHYIAQRRFVIAGIFLTSEKLLALAIVLVAVQLSVLTYATLPIAIGAAGVITGIGAFIAMRPSRESFAAGAKLRPVLAIWRESGFLGLASLAPAALLLDATIVVFVSGENEAGLLAVASRLTAPLGIAATALVAVILPHYSSSSMRTTPSVGRRGRMIVVALILALGLILVTADSWVPLLFSDRYLGAVWPVRFYVANVIVVLGTRALVTILQAWNDDRTASLLVVGQVGLALAGLWLGAELGDAVGASLAVLTSNILLVVALWWRVRRVSGRHAR